jgi:hypothetical protein
MPIGNSNGLNTGSGIKQSKLLVSTSLRDLGCQLRLETELPTHSRQQSTGRVPSETLDGVSMALEGDGGRLGTVLNVPESDQVITGRGREEVRGCRVELDLSDFPTASFSVATLDGDPL